MNLQMKFAYSFAQLLTLVRLFIHDCPAKIPEQPQTWQVSTSQATQRLILRK
ncbi:hypothetical protein BofuT4_P090570.1 [Botrytis cinerea T4]|uniref:Uncharacterized protein n=1 Tax=Botryotinia fuckeliana (strain T4) TaxID=999810 RepID=G2YEX7_BOTF4|nr:hypothetical protein BofuT4_P090570.1 [Botrytis cinerea T4]